MHLSHTVYYMVTLYTASCRLTRVGLNRSRYLSGWASVIRPPPVLAINNTDGHCQFDVRDGLMDQNAHYRHTQDRLSSVNR